MHLPPRKRILMIGTAALAILAMSLVHISTPAGAGLANDSAAYVGGARSILAGTGYSDVWLDSSLEPITHYPPLFSIILSAIGVFGIDPLRSVRVLNILFFGFNTALVVTIAHQLGKKTWLAMWAGGLFVLNSALLRVSLFAMSEPLFLFLSLCSLALLIHSIENYWKTSAITLSGVAAGLSILTRYSGLALLPAAFVVICLDNDPWRQKAKRSAIFLTPSLLMLGAWLARNRVTAGNATNRMLELHMVTMEQLQAGIYNLSRMLVPFEPVREPLVRLGIWNILVIAMLISLGIGLVLLMYRLLRKRSDQPKELASALVLLYLFSYFGLILASISLFDHSTRLIDRILAPGVICLLFLLTWLVKLAWEKAERAPNTWPRIILLIGMASALLVSAAGQVSSVQNYSQVGQGYASWKWHDSEILASVKALPTDIIIYTNTPPAVYLVTGRASRVMPSQVDPVNGKPRSSYDTELKAMAADIMAGRAVLALFNTTDIEASTDEGDLEHLLSQLPVLKKTGDATLFGVSLP